VSKIFFALWDFPAKLLWDKDLKKENAYIGISVNNWNFPFLICQYSAGLV